MAELGRMADIRAGIANNLSVVGGLRVYAYAPDSVSAPCVALIGADRIEYDQAMGRGLDFIAFRAVLLAARADARSAATELDGFLDKTGPSSIKEAVESDRTLGGAAQDCYLRSLSDFSIIEWAGVQYLGCALDIEVRV